MLLYFNNSNTMRVLERKSGSELRYNRKIFFANNVFTEILKFVINISISDDKPDFIKNSWIDEETIFLALDELAQAGIPLSFWGTWIEDFIKPDILRSKKE